MQWYVCLSRNALMAELVCFPLVQKAECQHTGRQHRKTPQSRRNVQQQRGFRDEMHTLNIEVSSLRKNKLGADFHFPTMT